MEQELDSLVPVSNGYLYRHKVGEVGENAKGQNGGNSTVDFNFKVNQITGFNIFVKAKIVSQYENAYEEYSLLLKLKLWRG